MPHETKKSQSRKPSKVYAVKVSQKGSQKGRYLRYRSGTNTQGSIFRREDLVGNMEDASRFMRFDDARSVAGSIKESLPGSDVFVVEILGRVLGRSHCVKTTRKTTEIHAKDAI